MKEETYYFISYGLKTSIERCISANSDKLTKFITAEDLIGMMIKTVTCLKELEDYKEDYEPGNDPSGKFSDYYEEMEILKMYLTKVTDGRLEDLADEIEGYESSKVLENVNCSEKYKAFSSDLDKVIEATKELRNFREDMFKFSDTIGKNISLSVSGLFNSRLEGSKKLADVVDMFSALLCTIKRGECIVSDDFVQILIKYGVDYDSISELILTKDPTRCRCDWEKYFDTGKVYFSNNTEDSLRNDDCMMDYLGSYLKEKTLDYNSDKFTSTSTEDTPETFYKKLKNKSSNKKESNEPRKRLFDGEDSKDLFEKAGAEGKAVEDKDCYSTKPKNTSIPTLDQYGTNLNKSVVEGKIDPVIGRDKEIDQVIEVLCCRRKSSVMLIGEPGCGKTAIVEGLATKLVNNDVPDCLKGKILYTVSTADLTAGTMYRGQLEERLQSIIKELKAAKDIILYIDEFHQTSGEEKSTSIADFLKPALSRGEISLIASTTTTEYKKYVEKDGALKRRFQKVIIKEPTKEETLVILQKLAKYYSEFHKVSYSDEVIKSCVELSDKYIYDRSFPDKAIDVMDISGSYAKLDKNPEKEKAISEIENLENEKIASVCNLDFKKAIKLRGKEENLKEKQKDLLSQPSVTVNNVASVISKFTNIPVDEILNPEIDKLRQMKQNISSKIIGQDEAIKVATTSLSKSFLGLRDENKPIAALMFIGPTGVGKTLLCEEICKTIYGDPKALIRIDCGEYTQSHTVTKLIGAPASYVGYGEPGILDQVRERPHSLILFDEIEKMHKDIINTIFLNILSTGFIKMSNGVEVSFRNSIIVFTGNVGTKELQLKGNGIGFGELNSKEKSKRNTDVIMKALKDEFRPEFINRLTNITVFNELAKEDMSKIFELELNKLKARLAIKNFKLEVSDKLKEYIISKVDTKYGARDLSRGISANIEDKICEFMLEKSCGNKTNFSLDLKKNDEVVVKLN